MEVSREVVEALTLTGEGRRGERRRRRRERRERRKEGSIIEGTKRGEYWGVDLAFYGSATTLGLSIDDPNPQHF